MTRTEAIAQARHIYARHHRILTGDEAPALAMLIEIAESAARGVVARQARQSPRTRERAASRGGTAAWAGMRSIIS